MKVVKQVGGGQSGRRGGEGGEGGEGGSCGLLLGSVCLSVHSLTERVPIMCIFVEWGLNLPPQESVPVQTLKKRVIVEAIWTLITRAQPVLFIG